MAFRSILSLNLLLLLLTAGCGDFSYSTNKPDASLAADSARNVDLGKLPFGEVPKHTFVIRNTTNSPFRIVSIRKSCGCETADITEGMVVAEGDALFVPYSLSLHRSGEQTGRLFIATDSSTEQFKEIELTLRACLPRKIWTTPESLIFDTRTEKSETEIRVESELSGLLDTFREATTCRQLVNVQVKEHSKELLVLSVSLAPNAPDGDAFDYLILRFDDPINPLHTVMVRSHQPRQSTIGWRDVVKHTIASHPIVNPGPDRSPTSE